MAETTQLTLAVNETDEGRTRPLTFTRCLTCGERLLRSRARSHADDHDAKPIPRWDNQFVEPTDGRIDE